MPLPHILYSALSVCRELYHLVSASALYFLGCFPAMDAEVSRTCCQNVSSSSDSLSLWSGMPHPSGKPCKRQHSSGVRRRMMYLRGGLPENSIGVCPACNVCVFSASSLAFRQSTP